MFGKKKVKCIDMSTGNLMEPKPVPLWKKVKHISVNTINGQHYSYKDAEFRATDNVLIIKNNKDHVFYNMENVIKYGFELE